MIGAVVIAHQSLAREMVAAVEGIAGRQEKLVALSNDGLSLDALKKAVAAVLEEEDFPEGVFLFVDMIGGSPWHAAMEKIGPKVCVLSGVNLSMLLSFLQKRKGDSAFVELAAVIEHDGKRGIRRW
jgi:mannose/fructose-specific phosphotransferase system component IIA